jgi:hypothetical protein
MTRSRDASRLVPDGADIIPFRDGVLSDKLGQTRAVEDYANQADPFVALDAATSAYEQMFFTGQSYTPETRLFSPDKLLTGSGTTFTANVPAGLTDNPAKSGLWHAMYMADDGDAELGSANQNAVFVSAYMAPTDSLAPYQKNGGLFKIRSADPSTGSTIYRDAVAMEAQADAVAGNMFARLFGAHSRVAFVTGSDGYTPGIESEIYNEGEDQPLINQTNSKHAFHGVASHGLVTAGLKLTGVNGGTFQHGVYADPESLASNFLLLRDVFSVNAAGTVASATGYMPLVNNVATLGAGATRFKYSYANEISAVYRMTSGSSYDVTDNDKTIVVNKATGSGTFVALPPSPVTGRTIIVKDGKGDAATNPITVLPTSGNIDGAANYVISVNRASATFQYDGTEWVVL